MDKVVASAAEAVADIGDGSSLAVGGFGLCGIPSVLIAALHEQGASPYVFCVNVDAVIAAHRGTEWIVQFMGFAPGFGYLVPAFDAADTDLAGLLNLPRRPHARTRVPAGSVAIAAGYSAVYPRDSPGGWNLLGRTRISLWSEHDDPPAMLAPGTRVRFVDAGVPRDLAARPDDDTENR